jgi:predicted RNase H-like HicB family nuclease
MSVRFAILYEAGPTSWGASVPDLPGCIAVGANRQEVETLIREAIEAHLDVMRECGIAIGGELHRTRERTNSKTPCGAANFGGSRPF